MIAKFKGSELWLLVTKLKPAEHRMFFYMITHMNENNEVPASRQELMIALGIRQPKTYYQAVKALGQKELVERSKIKIDTFVVNKEMIRRVN